MKRFLLLATLILNFSFVIINCTYAQSPHSFSFQAVVRDGSGDLVTSSIVGMRISLLQGSASGTVVYSETHTPTANANGLASVQVGGGSVVGGTFASIDWAAGPYYIKSETDPNGGTSYTISGTQQLLSVPYAMYAATSGSSVAGDNLGNHTATQAVKLTDNWLSNDGGAEGIRVNNAGLVGIGNSNPEALLHAAGEGRFETGNGLIRVTPTGWRASERATLKIHTKTNNPSEIDMSHTDTGVEYGWQFTARGSSENKDMRIYKRQDLSYTHVMTLKNADGNVGIGTTDPGAKLEVGGQVKLTGGSPGVGKVLTSDADGLASWTTPAGGIPSGSVAGNTPYWNGTAWVTNSSNIFNNGGNVGINTASPTGRLHITVPNDKNNDPGDNGIYVRNNGNAGDNDDAIVAVRVNGANAGDPFFSMDVDGVLGWSMGMDNSDADKFKIGTSWADPGTNTRLTIETGGNVGINTTTPTRKLDIDGDIRIRGGNPASGRVLTSTNANGEAEWQALVPDGMPNGSAAGNTIYWDGSAWVTSSSNIYNNGGNVGIATASPLGTLHVTSDQLTTAVDQSNALSGSSGSGGTTIWQSFTPAVTGKMTSLDIHSTAPQYYGSVYSLRIRQGEGPDGAVLATATGWDWAASTWTWRSKALPSMPTLTAGQVYSWVLTLTGGQAGGVSQVLGNPYPGGRCSNSSNMDYVFNTHMQTATPSPTLVAKDNMVGIGTSTPSARLDVQGNLRVNDGTATSGFVLTATDANGTAIWKDPSDIVNNVGNIGIGIADPTSRLHIVVPNDQNNVPNTNGIYVYNAGNNGDNDDAIITTRVNGANAGDAFFSMDVAGVTGWSMGMDNSDADKFKISNSWDDPGLNTKLTVETGGNVGIGNTGPAEKLEVDGKVRAQGYICRSGASGAYGGNTFNFFWTGSQLQTWIDGVNLGVTSDRRLKDRISAIPNTAISRVMQLRPVDFYYKKVEGTIFTGSDVQQEGFIADELQAVIPSAVTGEKDALTKVGTIQPQTVNVTPIISVLTKAVQEQQELIQSLLDRIAILEAKQK